MLLGAFLMYGIPPGPLLFKNRPDLVWGVIDSMYVGNIMLLILNLPLIGLFVRILYIPRAMLYPLIVAVSAIGVYAISFSMLDLYMMLFFGVIGYLFDLIDIPAAPLVLAMILGDLIEQSFRQAMTISDGSLAIFVSSGITISLLALSVISTVMPLILKLFKTPQLPEDTE